MSTCGDRDDDLVRLEFCDRLGHAFPSAVYRAAVDLFPMQRWVVVNEGHDPHPLVLVIGQHVFEKPAGVARSEDDDIENTLFPEHL